MTNLTEQWKKGELPDGHYYVKDGENLIAELLDGYFYNNGEPMTSFSGGVDEVLEEVPSYEKWQAVHEQWEVLLEENTKLKELLKECVELMGDGTTYMHIDVYRQRKKDVLNAISQVLGEE